MGFGLLLIGYFITFAFSLSQVYFFADIIGVIVMMYAFLKLSEYNLYYKRAIISGIVFLAACALNASAMLSGWYDMSGTLGIIVGEIKLVAECFMHVYIFLGARGISLGAGDEKLVRKAERQLGMSLIYYLAAAAVLIGDRLLGDARGYVNLVMTAYKIIWLILNLTTIYICFGKLYPADEDQTAPKKSRFAVINKINEKFDSFDKKSNEFKRESMRMANEEASRLAAERKKKKKSKKKR